MASVAMGYYPDQLLFWKAYQIPFIFDDPVQAINIVHKSYKEFPIFKQESDKINVNYLFQQPLGLLHHHFGEGTATNMDLESLQLLAVSAIQQI